MSITDKHLTRAQRTRVWFSALRDKDASATTERPFATGSHRAIITRIMFVNIEEVATADIAVDVGYTYSKDGLANPVTADADYFAVDLGFTNGLREDDTSVPVAAGSKTEHDVRFVVPKFTLVQLSHKQTTGTGTYYTTIEYHYEDDFPAEV